MSASEIEDRRQRAREAAYDAVSRAPEYYETRAGIEAAIEAATQVKITPEAIEAFDGIARDPFWIGDRARPAFAAFLAALGFEVVE